MNRCDMAVTRQRIDQWKAEEAARKKRLLKRIAHSLNTTGVWWAPSLNKWHDQTGIAHVVFDGGALCGSKPYSSGGSFPTPEAGGAKACRRCTALLYQVRQAYPIPLQDEDTPDANATP